jgi:hypothetical protein
MIAEHLALHEKHFGAVKALARAEALAEWQKIGFGYWGS